MEYLRDAEKLCSFEHRAAIKAEAFPVVGVVAFAGAVEALAIEEVGAVDEVVLDAVADAAVDNTDEAVVVLEWNGDGLDCILPLALNVGADSGVEREIDGDLVAQLDQLRRECSHYVGEAACFGEGNTLRGGKDYMH